MSHIIILIGYAPIIYSVPLFLIVTKSFRILSTKSHSDPIKSHQNPIKILLNPIKNHHKNPIKSNEIHSITINNWFFFRACSGHGSGA